MTLLSGNVTGRKVHQENFSVGVMPHFPLGLLEKYYPHIEFEYQTMSECQFILLDAEDFERRVMNNEETRALFVRILLHMNMGLLHIFYERNASSGYTTIRAMLERYLFRAESDKGYHEGIASFILKRTTFSKSYVFKILSSLKEGGYITVQNGKLISIDKKIPERY
ncbi:MAG TPA: helix-turn-helix domain-containing protein [Scandinavium sp.]